MKEEPHPNGKETPGQPLLAQASKEAKDKASLQRLHEDARLRGLECLDTLWIGMHARYRLRCANGHAFDRLGTCILAKTAHCEECRNQERLQAVVQMAIAKGGRCLETEYLGSLIPYRFVCAQGHEWSVDPRRMRSQNAWCVRCASIERAKSRVLVDGLEKLQNLAAQKGGQCLSDTYVGTKARYRMQCAQGHQWQTTERKLFAGFWCRLCRVREHNKKNTLVNGLERMQQAAQAQGGVCLAPAYLGSHVRYPFRCSRGHEWQTDFRGLKKHEWCKQCAREDWQLKTFKVLQDTAHARGGACLSEEYVRGDVKLHWECDRGHRWYAVPTSILKGYWCPECAYANKATTQKTKAKSRYQASLGTVDKLDF